MDKLLILIFFILGIGIGYSFNKDANSEPKYKAGLPSNCRALIRDNEFGVRDNYISESTALESIFKNCGVNGLEW